MLLPMCWYGKDSSNGLAMVGSKNGLGEDVRKVRERVRMSWGLRLSLHSVHEGLLKIYNKSQRYE